MKTTKLLTTTLLFVVSGVLACEGEGPVPFPASPQASPMDDGRITTDGDVALRNLNAQIDSLTQIVEHQPGWFGARSQLVDLLLAESQFSGRYSSFDLVDAITREGTEIEMGSAESLRLRATYQSAVHRFDRALELLDQAEALDGNPAARQRRTIALARGEVAVSAIEELETTADEIPSYESEVQLATYLAATGDYDGADDRYVMGIDAYRDVSPFPLAWVAFQRGVMWAEEADSPERSIDLYRSAIHRLPAYVVARVHGAELLWRAGRVNEAIELLEEIVDATEDPEPLGLLGEILMAEGKEPARAQHLIHEAKARYESLLSKHREAFLDHASEFFAGPGHDPHRALVLALENLSLRRNARAYRIAIEAAVVAGGGADLCRIVRQAEAATLPSPTLQALVARHQPAC